MATPDTCKHLQLACVNHYELIRKYRCADCGGIMICACDKDFGLQCLPHQLTNAHEYGTHQFTPVTLGFVLGACNACRGLTEEPHSMAQTYGRSNKIARFYWRELQRESLIRFDNWAKGQGLKGWMEAAAKNGSIREDIERQVLEEIKTQHQIAPKYSLREDSQDEVIRRYGIQVIALRGLHVTVDNRLRIVDGTELCGPEEFAARHFQRTGYKTQFVESIPFHVLFGTLMWMVIEDPADPRLQPSGFGDRHAFDKKEPGEMVWAHLPDDFGSSAYAERRATAIEEHLEFIARGQDQIAGIFDYWLEPSSRLRQYLWAYREEDVARARELLRVLRPSLVIDILRFLVGDYWGRYVGWPDLLCYRDNDFFFAEVKSSNDKLSQNQKEWISLNAANLRLTFKLVKIHRIVEPRAH